MYICARVCPRFDIRFGSHFGELKTDFSLVIYYTFGIRCLHNLVDEFIDADNGFVLHVFCYCRVSLNSLVHLTTTVTSIAKQKNNCWNSIGSAGVEQLFAVGEGVESHPIRLHLGVAESGTKRLIKRENTRIKSYIYMCVLERGDDHFF